MAEAVNKATSTYSGKLKHVRSHPLHKYVLRTLPWYSHDQLRKIKVIRKLEPKTSKQESLGIKIRPLQKNDIGAVISHVDSTLTLGRAGAKLNDVIVEINGVKTQHDKQNDIITALAAAGANFELGLVPEVCVHVDPQHEIAVEDSLFNSDQPWAIKSLINDNQEEVFEIPATLPPNLDDRIGFLEKTSTWFDPAILKRKKGLEIAIETIKNLGDQMVKENYGEIEEYDSDSDEEIDQVANTEAVDNIHKQINNCLDLHLHHGQSIHHAESDPDKDEHGDATQTEPNYSVAGSGSSGEEDKSPIQKQQRTQPIAQQTKAQATVVEMRKRAIEARKAAMKKKVELARAKQLKLVQNRKRALQDAKLEDAAGATFVRFKPYEDPLIFPESEDKDHVIHLRKRLVYIWTDRIIQNVLIEQEGPASDDRYDENLLARLKS